MLINRRYKMIDGMTFVLVVAAVGFVAFTSGWYLGRQNAALLFASFMNDLDTEFNGKIFEWVMRRREEMKK